MTELQDEPTHAAHTPEEFRIRLLERQVDHIIHWFSPSVGREREAREIGEMYREQRREFPFLSERTPDTHLDVDEVLRENESAIQQALVLLDPGRPYADHENRLVRSLLSTSLTNSRKLLEQRGASE
jgi:hypothetical protein